MKLGVQVYTSVIIVVLEGTFDQNFASLPISRHFGEDKWMPRLVFVMSEPGGVMWLFPECC